jgi:(p)ppGpp synthase/HD superfamily hydrolase
MSDLAEAWLRAWHFAAQAHQGQKLPGTELPYLVHIGAVAMEVLVAHREAPFADPELAVQCALLHDTVEDTSVTEHDIVTTFGAAVAAGVRALSKDPSLPKPAAMADSLRRIREQPREVWAVKLADRITNLQVPPSHWDGARIAGYRGEAEQILAELGAAHAALAERLARKIAAYPPRGDQR